MSKSSSDLLRIKNEAKRLIMTKGFTQKQAAQKLGISEKSMGVWCKLYGWKRKDAEALSRLSDDKVLDDFVRYIKAENPACHKEILRLLSEYMFTNTTINIQI